MGAAKALVKSLFFSEVGVVVEVVVDSLVLIVLDEATFLKIDGARILEEDAILLGDPVRVGDETAVGVFGNWN